MKPLTWGDSVLVDRHCETEFESRALRAAKRRVKYRQIGGDDGYQYCLIVDGRVRMSGLTRREVEHEVNRELLRIVTEVTA